MPILSINNLVYEAQCNRIIDNISFDVYEGEFLSIVGPSGSGKSTILKILSTLISNTSGNISYNKKALEEYNPSDLRKEISYCLQSPVLFGKTVMDNLSFPYEIRNEKFDTEKAVKFLENVGLSEDYLYKSINTLSGGEKQRVAVIRNILFQPKVLLLDEITSGLDTGNRDIIWNWLKEIKNNTNMTIIMISHNEKELELADRIIKIKDGKIVD